MQQEDPISPNLFILLIELLELNIQQNQQIRNVKLSNSVIKACQYADDITLFLNGENSTDTVLSLLQIFAHCSGLK